MESLIYKEKRTEKILKNERKKRIHAKKKKVKKLNTAGKHIKRAEYPRSCSILNIHNNRAMSKNFATVLSNCLAYKNYINTLGSKTTTTLAHP